MSKTPTLASVNGTTLSGAQLKTFLTGIVASFRTSGMQEIDRATITSDTTLTVQNCGLVLVDCTSGNVDLELPVSGSTTDDAIYMIRRLDSTGNTLTATRGGSDTVEGSSSPVSISAQGILGLQLPSGGTDWKVFSLGAATPAGARTAIGAAAAGANSDITSLSGLTTPISVAQGGAGLQPISASVGASALTIQSSALALDFRSTTLGSGTISRVTGTPSSLVISSGSTLGTSNGVQNDIAVLAINNAGTIELAAVNVAGGVDLSETGLISTTAEGGAGAADSATTIYSTTARTNVAYRLLGIIRSTQATAGTWATAPSLVQGAGGQLDVKGPSMVRLQVTNNYGSTNTAIRRFSSVVVNQGQDITYVDSAANGASFQINRSGNYAISYSDSFSASSYLGISVNSNQLATAIQSITAAHRLELACTSAVDTPNQCSWTGYLNAGDIVRPHCSGTTAGAPTGSLQFTITRVG